MTELEKARARIADLHAEEARERKIAMQFPDGEERDAHWMRGERLSDEAWHLEETLDLEPLPSGLWQ